MRLSVRHATDHAYEPAAPRAALRLRLFPAECGTQVVEDWQVEVNGEAVTPMLTDAAGDAEAMWFSDGPADKVTVVANGFVETRGATGVVGKLGRARPAVFLRRTRLTEPDEAIEALAGEAEGDGELARLHDLCHRVPDMVAYRPGATASDTTAAEALAIGGGVCQDQSHVFIAAARTMGIPARYVAGYLHDSDAPLAETHAWAEAHLDGLGWVGFDPTHGRSPTEDYVRLCSGLDAWDAAPLRGSIQGGAVDETLWVSVSVEQAQQ